MPRIVVTRRLPDAALEVLAAAGELWVSPHDRPLTVDELHAAAAGGDALVVMLHDAVDGALLDAAGPALRVVATVAVGHDNIDLDAAAVRGVCVTNTPGVLTDATADLAMALLLAVMRRLAEGDRLVRRGEGWSWHIGFMLGTDLRGKVLGIVGPGQIGQAVARRAAAFGMAVVHSARRPLPEDAMPRGTRRVGLDELFEIADVVSLHCPLTPETRHLVDAARLATMKPTAFLVNTARGQVVDEAALADALERGTIAGAGLDVFEDEPHVEPRLLARDDVVLMPHLGSATTETRTAMAVLAARNVVAVLAGGEPLTEIRSG